MKPRHTLRRRGQPLIALALVLSSWVGARVAMFDGNPAAGSETEQTRAMAVKFLAGQPAGKPAGGEAPAATTDPGPGLQAPDPMPTYTAPQVPQLLHAPPPAASQAAPAVLALPAPAPARRISVRDAANHQELWLAGMSQFPPEPAVAIAGDAAPFASLVPASGPQPRPTAHWSADGWLLWRDGGNGFNAPGAGLPGAVVPAGFYGGSQGGLVLRYFLAPQSRINPAVYVRASSGLEQPRGEEVAAGVSFRPVPGVPVRAMVEGRVTRTLTGTIVRPAAALVSELPAARLPLGLRGEAYVQAGYVGGRAATAFVDGQARVEKPIVRADRFELRAGAGVWGGAQRGASRLDVGPTATAAFRLGPTQTRLSADYRWRVAGNAAPGSGPVITLSAGF